MSQNFSHLAGADGPEFVPVVMLIGGLDPSGGAGLTADARALMAFGAHACPITTAVIAQNTQGVREVEPMTPEMIGLQMEVLCEDIQPDAVKIGMLPGLAAAEVIATRLRMLRDIRPDLPVIIDTVFAPSSGPAFMDEDAIQYVAGRLLPACDIVTPNISEATALTGLEITDLQSMAAAAVAIFERFGAHHVLIKGGHLQAETADAAPDLAAQGADEHTPYSADIFFDGIRILELRARRITGYQVRGTGCLLASAMAGQRARGISAPDAARAAKTWLTRQIQSAQPIGGGSRIAL